MIRKYHQPDYILAGVSAILLVLGVLILASVSAPLSQEKFGHTYYYLRHQILFALLPGIILAFICYKIPLDFLRKFTPILLLMILFLMTLVFLPKIGIEFRGATRWLNLGPISLQPSEFLKPIFILYLAAWLATRTSTEQKSSKGKIIKNRSYTLFSFLIIIGIISGILIFQPDISTLAVIILVAVLMYFLANTPLWHSILIILIGIGGLLFLIKLAPYRLARILIFLNLETDPLGLGYQIKQALIAVGSGGIFGRGLGMSVQKFGFLPQPISDSIFAVFAEEAGFIGAVILVLLFLIFLWQGVKIGKNSPDKFSQILALGITSWIVIQGFVNISSIIHILPITGIPLPFISYGGSALVAELIGVGILLNISRQTI